MTGWRKRGQCQSGRGKGWKRSRARIMARDMHLCQVCQRNGRATPATEVDHITPLSLGGSDDDQNLQAICEPCHKAKTEREAAKAQGRRVKVTFGADGWPIG